MVIAGGDVPLQLMPSEEAAQATDSLDNRPTLRTTRSRSQKLAASSPIVDDAKQPNLQADHALPTADPKAGTRSREAGASLQAGVRTESVALSKQQCVPSYGAYEGQVEGREASPLGIASGGT